MGSISEALRSGRHGDVCEGRSDPLRAAEASASISQPKPTDSASAFCSSIRPLTHPIRTVEGLRKWSMSTQAWSKSSWIRDSAAPGESGRRAPLSCANPDGVVSSDWPHALHDRASRFRAPPSASRSWLIGPGIGSGGASSSSSATPGPVSPASFGARRLRGSHDMRWCGRGSRREPRLSRRSRRAVLEGGGRCR